MSDVKELLDFEIYPRLDRYEAVKDLNPKEKGSYYLLECPECNKREAYLYKNGTIIKCNRLDKCGHSISLWDYIQTTKGLDNYETLKELARLAGYTLPTYDSHSWEKADKAREQANILETALDFFRAQLWTNKNKEALDYLRGRGYTDEEIKSMELGYYPSEKGLEDYLVNKGYSANIINSTGLKTKGFGETHTIVIPYRDPVGRLKGFVVRSLLSNKELEQIGEKKYKYNFGLKLDTPFNLHGAREQKNLVVVEGFLDALIATQRGIKGIVATGGASLRETQLENAARYGAKNFILALDNDEAGRKGTEKTIGLIGQRGLRAFVVTLPEGYKDPDELIKAEGIGAFQKLVEHAQSAAKWKAHSLLSKHSLQTDIGTQNALDEALAFEETLEDPIDSKDFVDTITKALDIPLELLEPKIADYHAKKARKRLEKGYKEFFGEGSRLLEEGKLSEIKEYIEGKLPELRAKAVSRTIEPYRLQDLQEDITQTREGLETGYESLNKLISIPQEAITIIAGRPSHGKTTLLLNLFLNMARRYPDRCFFFFSYEESRRQIGLKLLNILSGTVIDENHNLTQIENYLRGANTGNKEIEEGKAKFTELMDSGRLWIIDEPYFVDDLADTLAYLSERYDIGAVFIDYIQKVKIKGRYQTRQLELQKISERILETAKELSLPVILGAQLGRDRERKDKVRLDNLREAGDIEQDANLVIGLYNEAMEKAQEEEKPLETRTVDLELTILKNRNGIVNEATTLIFDRSILTIRERDRGNW